MPEQRGPKLCAVTQCSNEAEPGWFLCRQHFRVVVENPLPPGTPVRYPNHEGNPFLTGGFSWAGWEIPKDPATEDLVKVILHTAGLSWEQRERSVAEFLKRIYGGGDDRQAKLREKYERMFGRKRGFGEEVVEDICLGCGATCPPGGEMTHTDKCEEGPGVGGYATKREQWEAEKRGDKNTPVKGAMCTARHCTEKRFMGQPFCLLHMKDAKPSPQDKNKQGVTLAEFITQNKQKMTFQIEEMSFLTCGLGLFNELTGHAWRLAWTYGPVIEETILKMAAFARVGLNPCVGCNARDWKVEYTRPPMFAERLHFVILCQTEGCDYDAHFDLNGHDVLPLKGKDPEYLDRWFSALLNIRYREHTEKLNQKKLPG